MSVRLAPSWSRYQLIRWQPARTMPGASSCIRWLLCDTRHRAQGVRRPAADCTPAPPTAHLPLPTPPRARGSNHGPLLRANRARLLGGLPRSPAAPEMVHRAVAVANGVGGVDRLPQVALRPL